MPASTPSNNTSLDSHAIFTRQLESFSHNTSKPPTYLATHTMH